MAVLKLGLVVAELTSFPWKQPLGQLVPLTLAELQPLTVSRSWPTPLLAGGES